MRTRIICTIACLLLAAAAFAAEPCVTENGTSFPINDTPLLTSYWEQSAEIRGGVCTYQGPLDIRFPEHWTLLATEWTFTSGAVLTIDWRTGGMGWENGRFDGAIAFNRPRRHLSFPGSFATLTVKAVTPDSGEPVTRTYTRAQLLADIPFIPTRVTWGPMKKSTLTLEE